MNENFKNRRGGSPDAETMDEIIKTVTEAEERIKKQYERIEKERPPLRPYYTTIKRDSLRRKVEYLLFKYLDPHFMVRYANRN